MSNSPLATRFDWAYSGNYTQGRQEKLRGIVIHHACSYNIDSVARTFQTKGRNGSAHYCVCGKDISLMVDESNTAWHCSNWHGNNRTIGIETCNETLAPDYKISDQTFDTLCRLVADIAKRNGFGKLQYLPDGDGTGITGHKDWVGASTACCPLDVTDVLTDKGFVSLRNVTKKHKVAQWDTKTMKVSFANPISIVGPFNATVKKIRYTELTNDHTVFTKQIERRRTANRGKWTGKYEAKKWGSSDRFTFPVEAKYHGKGLGELTPDEIEYLLWVQADGHYMYDKRKGGCHFGIEFHFSKQRKINRVISLLEDLGKTYTFKTKRNGTVSIRIYGKSEIEWAETYLCNKELTWDWLKINDEQYARFKETILLADGCVANTSYSSKSQTNIDIAQAILQLHGQTSVIYREKKYPRLFFGAHTYSIDGRFGEEFRETEVGCVSMPKGTLIVRQYGKIQLIGNCPGPWLYPRLPELVKRANDINYPPAPTITWTKMGTPRKMLALAGAKLVEIKTGKVVKTYNEDTEIDMYDRGVFEGKTYYRSQYSHDKGIENGIISTSITEVPTKPTPEPATGEPSEPTQEPEPATSEPSDPHQNSQNDKTNTTDKPSQDSQTGSDTTGSNEVASRGIARLFQIIWNFIKSIFTRKGKK